MTQRIINDKFWTDPYIEDLDPSEKLVFIYLLSNPLCNIAGSYEIKNKRISYETGFSKGIIENILERFKKDGKIYREKDWLIIKNFAKNQSANPNVKKGMQRIINTIPEEIVKACKGFERLPYFTLLNLTLPNLTLPNPPDDESSEEISIEKTKEEIIQGKKDKFILLISNIKRDKARTDHNLTDEEINDLGIEFINYWTEPNESMTKIKYDYEKTFEVGRRFGTFIKNRKNWGKGKNNNFSNKKPVGLTTI